MNCYEVNCTNPVSTKITNVMKNGESRTIYLCNKDYNLRTGNIKNLTKSLHQKPKIT